MPEIFDNALDAWNFLVDHGGLEINGRDAAFLEQLVSNLTASKRSEYLDESEEAPAPDINEVLKQVSVEQLVNAMFVCMGLPFIRMMQDLLDHFVRTQITEGPGQWKLLLTSETDKLEVDLDEFRKWIESATAQSIPLMVPILKSDAEYWEIMRAFFDEEQGNFTIGNRSHVPDTDSGEWLSTSESTAWLPLPPVVQRTLLRAGHLRDVAALVWEIASAMQSIVPNYLGFNSGVSLLAKRAPEAIRPYVFIEHDGWIESMVRNFAAFEDAGTHEQASILSKLRTILDGVPLQPSQFVRSFEDLTAFLDLPIWKKRYELYSAWLLTQFLAAMDGHSITYHDEDGKLTFGFHATKFATINSTHPPIDIIGERRIAAAKLKGHGRKENIQPDYTVWTHDTDRCVLALEAKHYKRGSYRNFRDALDDYASNLPDARVFLGNYGPIHAALELDTRDGGMSKRQFAWGNLNPGFPQVVTSFHSAIQKIFGNPDQSGVAQDSKSLSRVLGIDVSPSMHEALESEEVQRAIAEIVSTLAITHFAAVNDHLLVFEQADVGRIPFFISQSASSGTELKSSASSLFATASALFFLTDREGLRSLGSSAVEMRHYLFGFPSLIKRELTLARIDS